MACTLKPITSKAEAGEFKVEVQLGRYSKILSLKQADKHRKGRERDLELLRTNSHFLPDNRHLTMWTNDS